MNRFLLYTVGVIFALITLYFVVSTVIGLLMMAVFWGLAILAVVGVVSLVRRTSSTPRVRKAQPVPAEVPLAVGDTVRPTAAFDGPMELAFCDGTVEMISKRGIMVRFENGEFHSVSPAAIRRV